MKRKTTQSFRNTLRERYGTKCYVCGKEGVDYHHVIPLYKGGTDTENNFMALCPECHGMLHGFGDRWSDRSHTGRKKKINKEGFKYVLNDFIHCKIGTSECKDIMGYSQKTHLTDRKYFKECLDELGVVDFRNNVDLLRAKKENVGKADKEVVGWVVYKDGHKEVFDRTALRNPL